VNRHPDRFTHRPTAELTHQRQVASRMIRPFRASSVLLHTSTKLSMGRHGDVPLVLGIDELGVKVLMCTDTPESAWASPIAFDRLPQGAASCPCVGLQRVKPIVDQPRCGRRGVHDPDNPVGTGWIHLEEFHQESATPAVFDECPDDEQSDSIFLLLRHYRSVRGLASRHCQPAVIL
jgi:hypothetical protein